MDGNRVARELFAMFLVFWGLLLLVSLVTYSQQDPSINHVVSSPQSIQNGAGLFGAYLSGILVDFFGVAAYVWPLGFLLAGGRNFVRNLTAMWWRWVGIILFAISFCSMGAAVPLTIGQIEGGGFLGRIFHKMGTYYLHPAGGALVWIFLTLIATQLTIGGTWEGLVKRIKSYITDLLLKRAERKERQLHYQEQAERDAKKQAVRAEEAEARADARAERKQRREAKKAARAFQAQSDKKTFFENLKAALFFNASRNSSKKPSDSAVASLESAENSDTGLRTVIDYSSEWTDTEPAYAETPLEATDPSIVTGTSKILPHNEGVYSEAFGAEVLSEHEVKSGSPEIVGYDSTDTEPPEFEVEECDAAYCEEATEPSKNNYITEAAFSGEDSLLPVSQAGKDVPAKDSGQGTTTSSGVIIDDRIEDAEGEDILNPFMPPANPTDTSTGPKRKVAPPKRKRKVTLPNLDLLTDHSSTIQKTPKEALEAKGNVLMECLGDFGIKGELQRITPGPVVTMFEIKPAPGVKVSKIANLADDLAMALMALSVRIQAPIPGRDTVGVEIPNELREMVCLRELFASKAFKKSNAPLTLAVGKDIAGIPSVTDLAKMPHLLVAGATGQGKSVFINSVLMSLLFRTKPEDLQLLLIDPKRIELAVYADLPHLVHPVVTDMSQAKNALDWAVHEMDKRYEAMAQMGVRNITGYNDKLHSMGNDRPDNLADLEPLPYMVIIIDELADLMLTAAKEVETSIVRLAQLARAAGMHLILATQRPSVDVVTGLIKANFPCRVSFQVTAKHDSRTILDTVGAEMLLGKGDMLFKPGGGRLQRMHGAFVSDDDVSSVVDFWKKQLPPSYKVDFAEWGNEGTGDLSGENGGNGIPDDPVYQEAVQFVLQQGKASISLIQRRFRIGFNRAARYVEQMEQDGIIGPADGSKPRAVLGIPGDS